MTTDRITVTVTDDHLQQIDQLAERLRAAGMQVEQVLRPIGLIIGSVDSERRLALTDTPGVARVEDETSYQLPPPDAEIQ
jgi:hypothetical protein